MLALIRKLAKTWPARVLFAALVIAFGLWGVAGRLYNQGGDTAVAHVGGSRIESAEAQRAYAQQMAQITKQNGADFQPPPALRQRVALQAVQQLVLQKAVGNELTSLGVTVPDAAVREATFALPAFKNTAGQFDKQQFLTILQRNNLDEASFIALEREDISRQQLTGAIGAGVASPDAMLNQLFAFARETRTATAVSLPIAGGASGAAPTDADLRRFWTNNPTLYATPEYRRIKVIVLSGQTLARDMAVSEDDIKAYYNSARASYDKPEQRSLQVVSAPDQATAARIAAAWRSGADWAAVQAQSKAAGANAVELPDARRIELPDTALAAAAFAATPDTVSQPVQGTFGWFVAKVTKITAGSLVTLEQARADIREKIGVLKANDQIDDRANKVEDALAGGGGLDNLPSGLGLAAVQGTMDAAGNTPAGVPAPLPATAELRAAIVAAAFKARPGDPPHLEQLAASRQNASPAYYAVAVDHVEKPAQLGYDQVTGRVQQDWTRQQMRRAQEQMATTLLTAARTGTPLPTAALVHGLTAQSLPPVPRPLGDDAPPPAGVPANLVAPLFGMKQGEATMIETPEGFMVVQLQTITQPSAATDTIGAAQLRTTLNQSIGNDVTNVFVEALRARSKVTVNQAALQQIAPP